MSELVGNAVGSVQSTASSIISKGWSLIDKVISPEKRTSLMAKANKFAQEQPKLASFLLSHIALSGLPIAIFVVFTITVAIFALLVAIILALLAAVLFIVLMAGFALAVLFPTLLFTTFVAVTVWLWGWGAWYLLKWFNQEEIPGVHTSLTEGLKKGAIDSGDNDDNQHQQQKSTGKDHSEEQTQSTSREEKANQSASDGKTTKRHPGHKVQFASRPVNEPSASEDQDGQATEAVKAPASKAS